MRLRMSAKTIDVSALIALAALVLSYSLIVGDTASPSAGWAWLGVAVILFVATAARLSVGARPSERGVAVGVAALTLGILRIAVLVKEVTLPIALATLFVPLLIVWISRRRSVLRRQS